MATLPSFLRRQDNTMPRRSISVQSPARPETDAFVLRPIPLEDVFFHCKRIDNSRLEREPDPREKGACWSTIGAATVLVAVLGSVLAPTVAGTLAGYRMESLRSEERRLLDEKRVLEAEEAALLSPERLQILAEQQQLTAPRPGQVIHVDGKNGAVAMAK